MANELVLFRRVGYAAALVGALLLIAGQYGCGDTTLIVHAKAAEATRELLMGAKDTMRAERLRRMEVAVESMSTSEEAQAAVDEIQREWEPAIASLNTAIEAHNLWVSSLMIAIATDDFQWEDLTAIAVDMARLWLATRELAATLGLDLPALPAIVVDLIER